MRRRFTLFTLLLLLHPMVFAQTAQWTMLRDNTLHALQSAVSRSSGIVGLTAIDLTSGEAFGINDTLIFSQGSAIKIPILMEVFKQAREGRFRLTDRKPVPRSIMVGGSGVLQYLGDGTSEMSIRDLSILMVVLSDNTATNMLIDLVGMENINRTLRSLGLRQTGVHRRMIDQVASARGNENLSTPAEAAAIMKMLYDGKFIDRATSSEIMDILLFGKSGAISRGVPDSIRVAFKPGEIAGVSTEWAVVYLPQRPYVVTVMGNYLADDDAAGTIKEISHTLFNYFWRKGFATPFGTYVDPALRDHK
jgi:beta-lactamase class A